MSKDLPVSDSAVVNKIYLIRTKKVMLDRDLAELYGVTTGNLNKAVKRNIKRFPEDFMFRVTQKEFIEIIVKPENANSWGGTRKSPYAFTEEGVAMLSGVLTSDRAIRVNIQIMRIFTRMREVMLTHKDILLKLEQLERKTDKHDKEMQMVFAALKELINPPNPPRKKIGFRISKK